MPYCDINEKIIARLVKRNSGISILVGKWEGKQ